MDLNLWLTLGGVLPLLLLSACLSGTETALTASRPGRLHQMADAGDESARTALQLTEQPERLLGAILIGNNLVNVAATSLATFTLVKLFAEGGVIIATLVMTALIVIFAEIAPKTYAISNPEKNALRAATSVRRLVWMLSPALVVVQGITRGILFLFRASPEPDRRVLAAQQEVRGAIELGRKRGTFVKRDRDLLVAAMDLDDTTVAEIMTPRGHVDMLNAEAGAEELLDTCLKSQHSRLPLWKDTREQIIGLVNVRDLFREAQTSRLDGNATIALDVRKIAKTPDFVPESRTLSGQLMAFQKTQSRIALVVDEYGVFQGVITAEDILEDIVGDLGEAGADAGPVIHQNADGSYLVVGAATIRDLNRECDWNLPGDHATTVAGLVIYEAQRIPEAGQVFNFHGFRFEITERKGNRIARLLVRALPGQPGETPTG